MHPLLAHYPAADGCYDEIFEGQNRPRWHWRAMFRQLAAEAPAVMRQRMQAVERQVRENGVTYNVYADQKGAQRPWNLNVLPLILPHHEWAAIEAAVIQRATLLNHILADIYGDQRLLNEGWLPPALIHGNAGFLRAAHGTPQPGGIALHLYAVDLARAPDGRWWVVADRTQSPSGAGYALENRSVIARAFPELYRDLRVQNIGGFFLALRDSLTHWGRQIAAARASEAPLIVLLTPGPYNETYYEQAYLARHLGFPLVEGSDLTVRNGLVWLKTLDGPQRVHVILRRVDDDYCDPLELRADSALGVAGLTDAARRGNVLVANSLGSNLLESGALLGYLPALCTQLLGEDLKMASVGTWWCGEPAALEEVVARLDSMVIKPAYPQIPKGPIFGQDLDQAARAELIAAIRAHPGNYVAQEQVRISQAPVWVDGPRPGLGASAVGMRVFACATPTGYIVMPGGLTRVATGPDARVLTMQRGGASKDTWIVAASSASQLNLLPRQGLTQGLTRGDTRLASRVVENLFWFGRYAERCDNTARLLRCALDFLLNTAPEMRGSDWNTVQALCEWHGLCTARPGQTGGMKERMLADAAIEAELLDAIIARDGTGLMANLQQLHRVAAHLRERLSLDNWHMLSRAVQRLEQRVQRPSLTNAGLLLDEAVASMMTLAGFALDGMTRDQGWRFLSLGRRLERLQFICTALEHALAMPADSGLDWLLEIGDSTITYRARYMAQPEWLPVLDLMVMDESNPRSVAFQLAGLLKYLSRLGATHGPCGVELLMPLQQELSVLGALDLTDGSARLADLLQQLSAAARQVSEKIGQRFFSYSGEVNHWSFAA